VTKLVETKKLKQCLSISAADPHHTDADPDTTYHFDQRIRMEANTDFDADLDAYPDPDFYLMWSQMKICNKKPSSHLCT